MHGWRDVRIGLPEGQTGLVGLLQIRRLVEHLLDFGPPCGLREREQAMGEKVEFDEVDRGWLNVGEQAAPTGDVLVPGPADAHRRQGGDGEHGPLPIARSRPDLEQALPTRCAPLGPGDMIGQRELAA